MDSVIFEASSKRSDLLSDEERPEGKKKDQPRHAGFRGDRQIAVVRVGIGRFIQGPAGDLSGVGEDMVAPLVITHAGQGVVLDHETCGLPKLGPDFGRFVHVSQADCSQSVAEIWVESGEAQHEDRAAKKSGNQRPGPLHREKKERSSPEGQVITS